MSRTIQLLLEFFPEANVVSGIEQKEISPRGENSSFSALPCGTHVGTNRFRKRDPRNSRKPGIFSFQKEKGIFSVHVPGHRLGDIAIPEDIAEEIVRISGLANIHESAPTVLVRSAQLPKTRQLRRDVADALVNMGFFECVTYAFLGSELLNKSHIPPQETNILVANPLSEDMSRMRPSLLPRLLEKAMENRRHHAEFRLFEIGNILKKNRIRQKRESSNCWCADWEDFLSAKGVLKKPFSYASYSPFDAFQKKHSCFCTISRLLFLPEMKEWDRFSVLRKIQKKFDLPELYLPDFSSMHRHFFRSLKTHFGIDRFQNFLLLTLTFQFLQNQKLFQKIFFVSYGILILCLNQVLSSKHFLGRRSRSPKICHDSCDFSSVRQNLTSAEENFSGKSSQCS